MNSTDLSATSARELAQATPPCITIMLAGDSATEINDALNSVRTELQARQIDPEPLLGAVEAAIQERGAGRRVVILRSPDVLIVENVENVETVESGLKPMAQLNDRFDLRALLALADRRGPFYILALSQKRPRILECTGESARELPLPAGFPVSLAEAMQTRQPDHVLDNRSSGGPSMGSMKGVMFGTSTDREDKDECMLHFFIEIDKAVNGMLKGATQPMVPVGVEHELALYRRVNTYPHLVEPGIRGAPDGLEGGEMHRRALELLKSQEPETVRRALADFDKQVGTGHASTHIQEIVAAAYEGRASHLFFQESAGYMGSFDPIRGRVKHTIDPLDSPSDLIDAAARQTILHGGEAHILPSSIMPNGVPVCAIFRYPAAVRDTDAGSLEAA